MRGPLAFVIASTVLVGATLSGGEALAQKKKVVVESFKGPAAPKYRIAVMKSLYAAGFEVIPDKTLVKVEADLGLQSVSQSYGGVAKELKLAGFVSGIITGGRRPKARVIVRDPSGKPIGGKIFQATSAPKLMAMVAGGSGAMAASTLGGAGGGGGGPVAAAEPAAAEPAAEPAAAEEPEEKPRKRKGDKEKAAEEEETPAAGDADAEVTAEAEESEKPSKKKAGVPGKNLRVAAVLRTFSRNFAYNQSKRGLQQGYQAPESKFAGLPLVPAPGIAVEAFPSESFGVFGSYNRGIVGSKDKAGSVYTTTAYSYMIGAKARLGLSSIFLEPSVGYGSHVFKISNFASSPDRIQVAPVDYKHARLGSDVRIPMSGGASVTAGGYYLHILSAGDILVEKSYFKGTAVGGEFGAAYNTPLSFSKNFDLSIGLDFRRIVFAFAQNTAAPRIAGGAVDQYIGLNLALGYNIGL
jgi:hypothetical protein